MTARTQFTRRLRERGVLVASAGLVMALAIGLCLELLGLIGLSSGEWVAIAALTVLLQTTLLLVPRLGLDRWLSWDPHYVLTPALGVVCLFNVYVYVAPEARFLVLMGWLATLLFLAGLVGFRQVLALGLTMGLAYLSIVNALASRGVVTDLPMEMVIGLVFLAINVFAAFVLERLRRNARVARVHAVWRSTADGIVTIGEDGLVLTVNPSAERIFGYPAGELLRQPASLLLSPKDGDAEAPLTGPAAFAAAGYDGELLREGRRQDGSRFPMALRVTETEYQGERVLVVTVQDITERSRSEQALRQSRKRLEHLNQIAHRLMSCETEEQACQLSLSGAQQMLGLASCRMLLAEGARLVVKARLGDMPDASPEEAVAHESRPERVWQTRETIVFDGSNEATVSRPEEAAPGVGVSAPVGSLGVFEAWNDEGAFEEDDLRLLHLLLGHVEEGLKRIRLEQVLREQAIRDPLTGVFNRRYLDEALQRETARAKRYGRPISFLMIDIDGFKGINDRFGHAVGDAVLKKVAQLLEQSARVTDVVIRFGGDEFLVVMPETENRDHCLRQRIDEGLTSLGVGAQAKEAPITLSVGEASWHPGDSRSVEDTLGLADERMYQDKKQRQPKPSLGAASS